MIEAVDVRSSASDAVALIDCRFAAAPHCPHCKSVDVGTWSKPKPLTRYMCHGCGTTFTALTAHDWSACADAMRGPLMARRWPIGISLCKAAKRCGIVCSARTNFVRR